MKRLILALAVGLPLYACSTPGPADPRSAPDERGYTVRDLGGTRWVAYRGTASEDAATVMYKLKRRIGELCGNDRYAADFRTGTVQHSTPVFLSTGPIIAASEDRYAAAEVSCAATPSAR